MKKKIFLFLILTILFTFTNVKAAIKNIEITNVSVTDKSGTITVIDPVFSSNEITSNITFNKKDDFVTFELTLINNENDKYKIESIKDNNTNNNLKIEYEYDTNYISKGNTSNIKVKLTYNKQLVNVDKISLNDLQIFINLVNEDGKSSEIIINPTTGDNVLHYLVLLVIALTGLVFVRNNKKKFGKALMILPIILLPFAVLARESYKINIRFTDIDVIGEFESYNITINPDNGDTIDTRTITYGQKIGSLPSDPVKEGYEFEKWVDNKGNEVTADTVITGPITIKAKYNIIKYDITYNYDGGSATNPSKYTIEDEITLNNPTRNGYSFAGWTGTGISTAQSTVTIPVGSTGARSYVAHWSAGEDTPYRVIHKYQNLDLTTYTDVVRNLTGPTGETITVAFESKYGFDNPASTQNVTIDPDELQVVTYYYNRTNYNFSISDRTYVDASSTIDGSYPYETEISVKALEREGYTFSWSDGNTNYERTFKLEDNKTIYPVYTANTNTPYTVKHYKMKLDGSTYELAKTENKTGTTGAEITPATETYIGFTKPSTETTTISGSGDTVVEYYYTRNKKHVTINNPEYVNEGDISGDYYYEQVITLTAKAKPGYTFSKWSNEDTNNPTTITIGTNDITIGPEYIANTNTPYKVIHKKQNVTLDGYEEIVENLTGTSDSTVTPTVNDYTGFTKPASQTVTISRLGDTVVTYVYDREIYTISFVTPAGSTTVADQEVAYGAKVTKPADPEKEGYTFDDWYKDSSYQTLYDYNDAVTESMPIYANYEINSYTVTFDTDGGSTETPQIVTYKGHATRPTTDPEKTGYDFINWYKDSNYETLFDFATEEITDETTIYAKFEIQKFTVTFNTDGGTNIPSQTVNYGSKVTRPADPEKTGYDFINWYKDSNYETLFDFDNTEIKSTTTIYAKFSQQSITVTFDTDGGSTVSPITVEQGESINELPTPTKENNKFLGWYENIDDANPVSEPYTPASSVELHAKWQKLVCKKATTLNTETCNSPSGKGCKANNYSAGDVITYGDVINSDTFKAGDALDCDVDGTGYNQRFYYITDNGDNAVLISHTTFSGDIGQSNINVYYNYATSLTLLPTTTQWSNLPVKFEIQSGDYRPARFIRLEEIQDMTGKNYTQLKVDGSLNDYEFLFENSLYSGIGERSTA